MKRQMLAVGALAVAFAACDSFKEAMTAHVDVVARAGSQELSVTRLGEMLGNANVPLQAENAKDIAKTLANLWVDYQLLAQAAAHGDSLADPKRIDAALDLQLANMKAQQWHEQYMKLHGPAANANAEAQYNQGASIAARHILFVVPQGAPPAVRDSVRRKAEQVRAQATAANFAQLAGQYSEDPGSKVRGGALGFFQRGQMVPEFDRAVAALKPGEISPLVETQFGYHIIYRQPYSEVKDEFAAVANQDAQGVADSTWLAELERTGNVSIKANAPKDVRAAAADMDAHRSDKTVVATSKAGDLTVGRVVQWLGTFPPRANVPAQLAQAPDSIIPKFLRTIVQKELVIHQADSAKVSVDTAQTNAMHAAFAAAVTNMWSGLGITPKTLADSAKKGGSDKERFAAARIETFMDELINQRTNFVDVPKPVETVLRDKYEVKINQQGIDRAVERALSIRAAADSTHAPQSPSAVPMPRRQISPINPRAQQGQPGQAPQQAPQQAPPTHP